MKIIQIGSTVRIMAYGTPVEGKVTSINEVANIALVRFMYKGKYTSRWVDVKKIKLKGGEENEI